MRSTIFALALSIAVAAPAAAQQPLKVTFQDGRVSVDATGATVRAILAEWSKEGGTKVIGAERVAGAPITLKLVNVTEAQALETILRSVAGYMAAPRHTGTGPSMYDRIMVMATSSTPPPVAAAARPANTNSPNTQNPNAQNSNAVNGTQRFVPPRQVQRPDEADREEADEPDENPPNPPVFTFPQPGQNGFSQQGATTAPGATQPSNIIVNPTTNPQPGVTFNPTPAGITPTMPGSSLPGMITAPPPPPVAPPPPVRRPPGGGGQQL
jgi:hypothetical protein